MTSRRRPPPRPAGRAAAVPAHERALVGVIVALLLVTTLVIAPSARDAFRQVKGLAAGWFGLLSIAVATWPLWTRPGVPWAWAAQRLTVRATLPLLVVVAAGAVWTNHPAHFREALADFLIGAACVTAWSLASDATALARALRWVVTAGVVVAVLTLDQAWGGPGVLDGLGVQAPTARLALTATLGNPGDIGAFLVLPLLVAAGVARRASGRERARVMAALGVMTLALAATATLTAIAAAAAGGALLWMGRLTASIANAGPHAPPPRPGDAASPARRTLGLRHVAGTAAVILGVALLLALVTPPLRARLDRGVTAITAADLNDVLTGRLDGWRGARHMLATHPMTGVGLGGFAPEFAGARLALMDRGVPFYPAQIQTMFATPHNEVLSVGAEQGWPGLLALFWGATLIVRAARRVREPEARGLAWGGATALAVLSLTWFPLHVAAVAWPWLLWLSWLDRASEGPA